MKKKFGLINFFPKISNGKMLKIIENYYIQKFGSIEAAEKYFRETNKHPVDEFYKSLNTGFLIKILKSLLKSSSITSLIGNLSNLKNDNTLDRDEINKSFKILKSIEPEVIESFGLSEKRIESNIITFLDKTLKLSLSKTRKELGYPDQRTFNTWLSYFFEEKFSNRGKNNGRISLSEYIEIVSAFMLRYDEKAFNFSDTEKLKNRFENERSIHKKQLKSFTDNNYAILKFKLEDIADLKNMDLPENYRKMPYNIASIFKSELKKYLE
jgi:hypothetical protein